MSQNIESTSLIEEYLDGSTGRIGAVKKLIKQHKEQLAVQFRSGTQVLDLMVAGADFIDDVLLGCWNKFLYPYQSQLALIAAGGYGRRELHPHSDIDILILTDPPGPEPFRKDLEEYFTFLWDIGLKIGHNVYTVDECVEQATHDQSSMTRLLETRLLTGSQGLFDAVKAKTAPERIWPSKQFFDAKMAEQLTRYKKYDGTAYKLEPNIKEGPGGLRDIQLIAWVIKRHYNSPTLRELVKHNCLTESEYSEFMAAQKYLWKVRFALHTLTTRAEERLLFDYQVALAELLGYPQTQEKKAVENFMRDYFRTVTRVQRLNEMLLQLFREVFLKEHENCEIIPINRDFQSLCDYIEVTHQRVFVDNPSALLEIFQLLGQKPEIKGVRAPTIRLIRQSLSLINDEFRNNKKVRGLFMEILRQPAGITHQLRRMNRYGVLAAYFPEFAKVVGCMQYDLFHIYTVDEHSLFVIRNLRRFALEKHNDELPFCNKVFMLIAKPELLYLAALLHDVGKGRGGDHSTIGEQIAEVFCKQHDLSDADTRLVTWLVRNHLIMSMTAQRKDIQDPDIIHQFALTVGNQEYLKYLYLLTVADIRATNLTLWNSWIDSLLKELYLETYRAFRRGLNNPIEQQERIKQSQQEARKHLFRIGLPEKDIKRVWRTISKEYFQRYSAEESVWHTVAIASCKPSDLPIVLLRPQSQRGTAEIFLYTPDRKFLFSQSTAILDQLGLTIVDARIITSNNGYVLNSYQILEQSGQPIRSLLREQEICIKVKEAVKNPDVCLIVGRRPLRTIKHFPIKTQVIYHDDPHNRYTILELLTTDRPGLLSKVGQAFDQIGIRLNHAKITTLGSRAEDLFYITDKQKKPLKSDELKQNLQEVLIEIVGKS